MWHSMRTEEPAMSKYFRTYGARKSEKWLALRVSFLFLLLSFSFFVFFFFTLNPQKKAHLDIHIHKNNMLSAEPTCNCDTGARQRLAGCCLPTLFSFTPGSPARLYFPGSFAVRMAMWLSSGQRDVDRVDVHHGQDWRTNLSPALHIFSCLACWQNAKTQGDLEGASRT